MRERRTVVGIDVGGVRKGFHAVALRDGAFLDRTESGSPAEIAAWCRARDARVVAIDAPCRWRVNGKARACERDLAGARISCFSTPSREKASGNPFYAWMINGAALYERLEEAFPLFDGRLSAQPMCVETFPQAVAYALAGKALPAKEKKQNRREVLRAANLDVTKLPNIDYVDAALCALAADHLLRGSFKAYGTADDGFIVVPQIPKLPAAHSATQ